MPHTIKLNTLFRQKNGEHETIQAIKGQTGLTGPQGPSGSDANVTSENIINALGYTPADNEDLDRKMEYHRVDAIYVNNAWEIHDHADNHKMTYVELKALFDDPSVFLYLMRGGGVHIPADDITNVADPALQFTMALVYHASEDSYRDQVHRVMINSHNVVSVIAIDNETTDNKVTQIDDEWPDGQFPDAYPTVDAVLGVTNTIKSELTQVKNNKLEQVKVAGVALESVDSTVDLPLGTRTVYGLARAGNGMSTFSDTPGMFNIAQAQTWHIDAKTDGYMPICPAKLDYAVRAGLLSNSQITDADKPLICETIGAEPAKGEWVLKGTITTETKADGAIVDLTGCTEIVIKGTATIATDRAASILISVDGATKNILPNVFDATVIGKATYLYATCNGLDMIPLYCARGQTISSASNVYNAAKTEMISLESIKKVIVQPTLVSECDIVIYAR